jgi:hypothetical protein
LSTGTGRRFGARAICDFISTDLQASSDSVTFCNISSDYCKNWKLSNLKTDCARWCCSRSWSGRRFGIVKVQLTSRLYVRLLANVGKFFFLSRQNRAAKCPVYAVGGKSLHLHFPPFVDIRLILPSAWHSGLNGGGRFSRWSQFTRLFFERSLFNFSLC